MVRCKIVGSEASRQIVGERSRELVIVVVVGRTSRGLSVSTRSSRRKAKVAPEAQAIHSSWYSSWRHGGERATNNRRMWALSQDFSPTRLSLRPTSLPAPAPHISTPQALHTPRRSFHNHHARNSKHNTPPSSPSPPPADLPRRDPALASSAAPQSCLRLLLLSSYGRPRPNPSRSRR